MSKEFEKYKLPKNWMWATLGDLGIVASGGTPSTRERRYWEGNIPWITPADLTDYKDKYISGGRRFITEEGLTESSAKLLPKGSILFSSRAPIGYVAIAKTEIATNQGFKNLIINNLINPDYIFHYLKSATQLARSLASGTTFLELSANKFSKIPIPIPPLTDQYLIIEKLEAILSELDKGFELLTTSKEKLIILSKVILKTAFNGDLTSSWRRKNIGIPKEILCEKIQDYRHQHYDERVEKWKKQGKIGLKPKKSKVWLTKTKNELHFLKSVTDDWLIEKIGNISDVRGGKRLPKGTGYSEEPTNHPYLRVTDFQEFGINQEELKFIKYDVYKKLERYTISKNDTFISIAGSIGISGTIKENLDKAILTENAAKLTNLNHVNNRFLAYYLGSDKAQKQIKLKTKATSQPKLALYRVEEILLPIPSLTEQELIVQEIDSYFSIINNLEEIIYGELVKLKSLRQSILKKTFEGKLVEPTQNNEFASDLLKKIKIEKKKYLDEQKKQRKKPKKIKSMDNPMDIVDVLKTTNQPISAKEVWEQSIHRNDIEAFYAELKKLQGKVEEVEKGMLSLSNES